MTRFEVVRQTSRYPDETVTPPAWLGWLVNRNGVASELWSHWRNNREQVRGVFYTSRPVTGTDQEVQP